MTAERLRTVPTPALPKRPAPPSDLSPKSRKLWRDLLEQFDMPSPHHLAILAEGLRALDEAATARTAVKDQGAFVVGRWGPRPHPGIALAQRSSATAIAAFRSLGLDLVEDAPPAPRSPSRWRGR